MFFIGGINTILPFIIYLSLLWICVIIGYSNKLANIAESGSTRTQIKHSKYHNAGRDYVFETEKANQDFRVGPEKKNPVLAEKHFRSDLSIFLETAIRTEDFFSDSCCICTTNYRAPPEHLTQK